MRLILKRQNPNSRKNDPLFRQRGQTVVLVIAALGVFLLGFIGLATDYTNFWFHRQAAQGAADAACQAGAMDLLMVAQGTSVPSDITGPWGRFTPGTDFVCASAGVQSPCKYAGYNGYDSAGLTANTASNSVAVTFPTRPASLGAIPAQYPVSTVSYMQVEITDRTQAFFSYLITQRKTLDIKASARCGLVSAVLPTPFVILHPTAGGAMTVGGSASVTIYGGPKRSIQVNSNSTTALSAGSINLAQAGPANDGDLGVFGGPSSKPASVVLGSGAYIYPASPFGDPYASVSAPSVPGSAGTSKAVPFARNGCPDPDGCVEFTGGNYSSCSSGPINSGANGCLMLPYGGSNPKFDSNAAPFANRAKNQLYALGAQMQPQNTGGNNAGNYVFEATVAGTTANVNTNTITWDQTVGNTQTDGGVTWQNIGKISTTPNTGIIAPGLYYVAANGLSLGSNSTIRMSTAAGDSSSGATFYFSTTASFSVGSNSGKSSACTAASSGSGTPNGCIVSYKVDGTASSSTLGSVASRALQCSGGAPNPSQVSATIDGNVLIGPCSGTYGDSSGQNRGFVFFQNRAVAAAPSWGGGGGLLTAGLMYFHQCRSDGTGVSCSAPGSGGYGTILSMSGGSSGSSYAVGNISADQLSLGGNSSVAMILNSNSSLSVLRAQLLP